MISHLNRFLMEGTNWKRKKKTASHDSNYFIYESLKYKLQASFYRIKNLIQLLRHCNFDKNFQYKHMDCKFLVVNFLGNFKNQSKYIISFIFWAREPQTFTKRSFYSFKDLKYCNFENTKKSKFLTKKQKIKGVFFY